MSSSIEFFGNVILYPKFNLLFLTKNGYRYIISDTYTRWLVLASLLTGLYFLQKFLFKIPYFLHRIFSKYVKYNQIQEKSFVIFLGYGDSYMSTIVAKTFQNLGYDLVLINTQESIENRIKYSMNKMENLENLGNTCISLSYEEILENPQIFKEKFGETKIDYIFDFSTFKVNVLSNKNPKQNNEIKNDQSQNFNYEEYNKDIEYYNSKIFYHDEINENLKTMMFLMETLLPYMYNTRILHIEYVDKKNDVNHKLMYDFKNSLYMNLEALNSYKDNYIYYVKKIQGMVNFKYSDFTENEAIKFYKYGNIVSHEFSFV